MPEQVRLDSWKEIARHLGRDVTTAIRWEKERGLPVHRVPGGKLSRVFAYTSELDDWLKQSEPAHEAPRVDPAPLPEAVNAHEARRYVRWLAGAAAVAAIATATAAGVLATRAPSATVDSLAVVGNAIVGRAHSGQPLWTHTIDTPSLRESPRVWSFAGFLDEDRALDTLASVDVLSQGTTPESRLHRFDAAGRLIWSFAANDQLTFRAGTYGAPWASWGVNPYRAGRETRIAWALHHYTWWPSVLVSLDAAGRRVGAFVNSGWIGNAAGTPDGRYLIVTGISNAHRAYFLAVLDAHHPSGASPEPEGSATECLSCPAGRPLHYFVFPRSDLSEQFPFPGEPPDIGVLEDGSLRIQTLETPGPAVAATVWEFDAAFRPKGTRRTDSFREWHDRLQKSGAIAHGAERCPEGALRHWTPGSGWASIEVDPGR